MNTSIKNLMHKIIFSIGFTLTLLPLLFYSGVFPAYAQPYFGVPLLLGQPLLLLFGPIMFFYLKGRVNQIIGVIFFTIRLFDTYIVYYEIMINGAL